MRTITMFLLLLSSCGRSECEDYATVWCEKYSLCVQPGSGGPECERVLLKDLRASHRTEEQCREARIGTVNISCSDLRTLIAKNLR